MGIINPTIPTIGDPNATEDADVRSALITLRDEINGLLDNANLKSNAALAHSKLANAAAGQLLIANGSGVITATTSSGDVTVNSSGVFTIGTDKITNAKMANDSVGAAEIIADSVGASELAPGAVTDTELNSDNLDGSRTAHEAWKTIFSATGSTGNGVTTTNNPRVILSNGTSVQDDTETTIPPALWFANEDFSGLDASKKVEYRVNACVFADRDEAFGGSVSLTAGMHSVSASVSTTLDNFRILTTGSQVNTVSVSQHSGGSGTGRLQAEGNSAAFTSIAAAPFYLTYNLGGTTQNRIGVQINIQYRVVNV